MAGQVSRSANASAFAGGKSSEARANHKLFLAVVAPLCRGVFTRRRQSAATTAPRKLHWPPVMPSLKSRRALDGPTSPLRRGGNLRLLRGGDSRRAFLSSSPVSFGHLAAGTELRRFSPTGRPQGPDPS